MILIHETTFQNVAYKTAAILFVTGFVKPLYKYDLLNGMQCNGCSPGVCFKKCIIIIRTLGTNFNEILSENALKMSSAKWSPFFLDLNELMHACMYSFVLWSDMPLYVCIYIILYYLISNVLSYHLIYYCYVTLYQCYDFIHACFHVFIYSLFYWLHTYITSVPLDIPFPHTHSCKGN